ncbi:hypothetical protein RI054_35g135930 [Pseudoscourfieldia marina]
MAGHSGSPASRDSFSAARRVSAAVRHLPPPGGRPAVAAFKAAKLWHSFMAAPRMIYKITSPSKRVYIGQTTYFVKRQNAYKRLASASDEVAKRMREWKQPKLRSSLRKYGYDAHNDRARLL